MALVSAKCTNCGADLNVDSSKETTTCQYCGTQFLVEKAISDYNDFEINGGKLVKYKGVSTNVVIPKSVKVIGSSAFEDTAITSVTIPGSVKVVEGFELSSYLESVIIEDGVEEINDEAFRTCCHLFRVAIPSTVKKIGQAAFAFCTSLKTVIINDGVEEIDEDAFLGCSSLEKIDLPKSICWIGKRAFSECDNLRDIIIRGTIKKQDYESDYDYSLDSQYPFAPSDELMELYFEYRSSDQLNECLKCIPKVETSIENSFLFGDTTYELPPLDAYPGFSEENILLMKKVFHDKKAKEEKEQRDYLERQRQREEEERQLEEEEKQREKNRKKNEKKRKGLLAFTILGIFLATMGIFIIIGSLGGTLIPGWGIKEHIILGSAMIIPGAIIFVINLVYKIIHK